MDSCLRVLGAGLLFTIAACTQAPASLVPTEPSNSHGDSTVSAPASREVQQGPSPWNRPYTSWRDRYTSRRDRNLARAHYFCGNAYRDCLDRDQAAHPGAPGALFGGSPEGRAACERAMNACYARYGAPSPPPQQP
jgi:hypothetical protein